ncbi:MAG: hypothetical protein AB7H66_00100 [Hyphomonadaceae bacterium]
MFALTDPAAHAALWKRAISMQARACAAIGGPAALAQRGALSSETRYDIAGWIARLESIVRKLLLALAGALIREERERAARDRTPKLELVRIQPAPFGLRRTSQSHAAPTPARNAPAPTRARSFDPEHPETWRARFALAPPRDPHLVPESRAPRIRALWGPTPPPAPPPPPRAEPVRKETTLRFAIRLEALRRVLADPFPYAERLGRLMHRLVRRWPHAAERYAIAPNRPCAPDEGDPRLIIDSIDAAMTAAPEMSADTS